MPVELQVLGRAAGGKQIVPGHAELVLSRAALCRVMLRTAALCCTMLSCAALRWIMLPSHCVMLHRAW